MSQPQAMTTLKKRADFLRAAAAGEKKVTQNIVVQIFRRAEEDAGGIRVGFTATKKPAMRCGVTVSSAVCAPWRGIFCRKSQRAVSMSC